jgi:exopolysaccharide biosynthesis protein
MGKYLCDGVLANQLYNIGYLLKNPVYGLMVYHYHISNIRNYSGYDMIRGQRVGIKFSENNNIYRENDVYDDGFNG